MNFEIIEQNINDILVSEQVDNDYVVLRYDPGSNSAPSISEKRQIVCYYESGDFPEFDNVGRSDYTQHKLSFKLLLTVAEPSTDESGGFEEAGLRANNNLNDFIRRIWQILMQGENIYLGTDSTVQRFGIVSNRRISNIVKSSIQKDNGFSIMNAQMDLTCQVPESPFTISGLSIDTIDANLSINSNPNEQTKKETGQAGVTSPTAP